MFTAWLTGFLIGFVGSMPIAGPIAALVFASGVEGRPDRGLFIALGGAVAEAAYAYLAFWGFSELLAHHGWIDPVSRALGAVVLLALGLRFVLRPYEPPATGSDASPSAGRKRSFALGLTITALNPSLIATWSAAVTMVFSLGVVEFDATRALPFSLGATVGIVTWFLLLLMLLGRFRTSFGPQSLRRVLRGTGVFLILLGIVFAVRFLLYFRTG